MDVEYDLAKAEANLKKHGVSFEEAASCLLDSMALVQEDRHSEGESRWVLVGLSDSARLLTVVYTLRHQDQRIRLISARSATRREADCYA